MDSIKICGLLLHISRGSYASLSVSVGPRNHGGIRWVPDRGVVLKKKWGTPETRLRQRFLNISGLHTRTLIHVRKIVTADLWSCPAIHVATRV